MPFEKGKSGNPQGRGGYEYEEKQMEKMKAILDKTLLLAKKMIDGKAIYKEQLAYENIKSLAVKIMDKIHPSKQDMKVEIEKPILIKTNGNQLQ